MPACTIVRADSISWVRRSSDITGSGTNSTWGPLNPSGVVRIVVRVLMGTWWMLPEGVTTAHSRGAAPLHRMANSHPCVSVRL